MPAQLSTNSTTTTTTVQVESTIFCKINYQIIATLIQRLKFEQLKFEVLVVLHCICIDRQYN